MPITPIRWGMRSKSGTPNRRAKAAVVSKAGIPTARKSFAMRAARASIECGGRSAAQSEDHADLNLLDGPCDGHTLRPVLR
jgi:hypothetical protein